MKLDIAWLIGLQRAQFNKSGWWRAIVMAGQLAVGIIASISIFIDDQRTLFVLSITAIIIFLTMYYALHKQRSSHATAECARRASVLMGGLGLDLPEEILQDIWGDATVSDEMIEASKHERYYGSKEPPGQKRLYEILHQSAFWTTFLQRKSSNIVWFLFILSMTISIFVFMVASAYAGQEVLLSLGRVVLVIASFLLTQGLFGAAMAHHEAATAGGRLLGRLIAIKAKDYKLSELLHTLMEYNSVVERAPLVFPGVYNRYRDRLNQQWEREEEHGSVGVLNSFYLGLENNINRLSDHNPLWAKAFNEEAERIRARLGSRAVAIEHYGSTAVPGLRAKPIIDILIGITDRDKAMSLIEPMSDLGYHYLGDQGIPDHHVFGKGSPRTHLAHVVGYQDDLWQRCLAFRDLLRSNDAVRADYEALKRQLAAVSNMSREDYTAGKTDFIKKSLRNI